VRVLASPEAVSFIREQGGTLFVWADVAECCTGPLTFLEASTDSPGADHPFRRLHGEDFDLFVDIGGRTPPEELHLDLKGWLRKHIRASWNGCAYALDP
jgi:hypothetical protein